MSATHAFQRFMKLVKSIDYLRNFIYFSTLPLLLNMKENKIRDNKNERHYIRKDKIWVK